MLIQVDLIANKCLSKLVGASSNKRGAFRMFNLCFQNTHQMGLGWKGGIDLFLSKMVMTPSTNGFII